MKIRNVIYMVLGLLLCFITNLKAQWDAPYSHFWMIKNSYNPSFAGAEDKISATAMYKQLHSKAEDAPSVVHFSGSMPFQFLGLNHGVGAVLTNSMVGKERNQFFGAQYSYNQRIGSSFLNIGVQAGFYDINYDASSIISRIDSTKSAAKQMIANPAEGKPFDFGAGVSWTSRNYFVGLGVRHINEARYYSTNLYNDSMGEMNGDSLRATIPMSYNFMAEYNIKLFNTLFEVEPMLFYESNAYASSLYGALQLNWNRKLSLGGMWRRNAGYSVFAGANLSGITLRYAYDQNQKINGINYGPNHEILIQYNFDRDLFKPKPQPYRSIRLL